MGKADDNPVVRAIARAWAEREFRLCTLAARKGRSARWPADSRDWEGTPAEVLSAENSLPTVDERSKKRIPTFEDLGAKNEAERVYFAERINEEARRHYEYLVHDWRRRSSDRKAITVWVLFIAGTAVAWFVGVLWPYGVVTCLVVSQFVALYGMSKELRGLRLEIYHLRRHVDDGVPDLDKYFMQTDDWIANEGRVPGRDRARTISNIAYGLELARETDERASRRSRR